MTEAILEPIDNSNYFSVVNTDYALLAKDAIDESTRSDNWLIQKPTDISIFSDNRVPTDVSFIMDKGKEYVRLEDAYVKVKWKIKQRDPADGSVTNPDQSVNVTLADCAWRLFRRVNLQLGLEEIQNVNHVYEVAPAKMLMDLSCEERRTLSDMYWFYAGEKNASKMTTDDINEFTLDNNDVVIARNPNFNPSLARRIERHEKVQGSSTNYITSILPLKYVLSSLEALPMIRSNEIKLTMTINDDVNSLIEHVGEPVPPGLFIHIDSCDLYFRCLYPSTQVEARLAESYLAGEIGHKFFLNTHTAFSTSHQSGQKTMVYDVGTFRHRLEGITFAMRYRDRKGKQHVNNTTYDHCGIRNFNISAGGRTFPVFPIRINFEDGDIAEAYLSLLTKVRSNNLRIDELSMITWDGFVSGEFALFYIDLSKYDYDGPDIDVKQLQLNIEFDPETTGSPAVGRAVDVFSMVEYYQELIINVADGKTIIQKTST